MLTTGSLPPLFAALLCALSFQAAAMPAPQQTDRIELRSYEFEDAGREVDYALYVPESYDEESPAPLVVLLHGLGSNPGQVMRYQGITAEAERRGYIVVAPYGYNERGWYGSRGHGKKGPYFGNAKDPDNLGELSEKDVMNVLGIVRAEFRVDPERIFLMGHSMGGAGTIYLGATHNGIWAGLAPMAPAVGGSMDLLRDLESIPVFVVTGDQDRLVRVELVRRWVKEMERLGVRCRYEEIEGGDHVRAIAANPQLIGRVFEFFDGLRKQAAATPADDAAEPTGDRPAPPDPPGSGDKGKVERDKTGSGRARDDRAPQPAIRRQD